MAGIASIVVATPSWSRTIPPGSTVSARSVTIAAEALVARVHRPVDGVRPVRRTSASMSGLVSPYGGRKKALG